MRVINHVDVEIPQQYYVGWQGKQAVGKTDSEVIQIQVIQSMVWWDGI